MDRPQTERLAPDVAGLARAVALLAAGEVVAFPTETVYGLGVRADSGAAVRALFAAKGRPEDKPITVHVADVGSAERVARAWDERARVLAAAFWPGPLTLVVARGPGLADEAVGGGATVGVRVPAHPVALALLGACSFPVAAPSANLSGEPPARSADEVLATLAGRIAAVLDGGRSSDGPASTVVDLTVEPARVLRAGALAPERLRALVRLA